VHPVVTHRGCVNGLMNKLTTKILIWHAVVAVLAWRLWAYGRYVSFNATTGIDFEPATVLNFVLLVSLMVLGYALFQKKIWSVSVSGVVGLLFLGYFGITWLNLLGVGLFVLLNLYSRANTVSEITERHKINIRRSLNTGLFPVVMAFFLVISFAAYQSPGVKNLQNAKQLPSQSEVFIQTIIEKTAGGYVQGNPGEKRGTINQASNQTLKSLNDFLRPYFKYSPPVVAFGLFLVLWGLSWIFVWLSVLLGMLIFWILKKTNVVKIEERDVKAETLII